MENIHQNTEESGRTKRRPLRSRKPARRRRVTKRKFNPASGVALQDVHTRIVNVIQAQILKGVAPWTNPVKGGGSLGLPRRHNGIPYQGINIPLLWAAQMQNGFGASQWMTFRQAIELNAHVRKGEHGSLVVYTNTIHRTEQNEAGEDVERDIPFLKAYTVFNVEQIDGLPDQYRAKPPPQFETMAERLEHAERFIANTKADIRYGGTRAFYSPKEDFIRCPELRSFPDSEKFYSTQIHELGHWSEPRLDIDFGRKVFGDEGYAFGELYAELTAAFVCAHLELTPEVPEHHAAYMTSWLRLLPDHPHAITAIAGYAQRSADYLRSLQGEPAPEPVLDSPGDGP